MDKSNFLHFKKGFLFSKTTKLPVKWTVAMVTSNSINTNRPYQLFSHKFLKKVPRFHGACSNIKKTLMFKVLFKVLFPFLKYKKLMALDRIIFGKNINYRLMSVSCLGRTPCALEQGSYCAGVKLTFSHKTI